jgi:hypothetical protein
LLMAASIRHRVSGEDNAVTRNPGDEQKLTLTHDKGTMLTVREQVAPGEVGKGAVPFRATVTPDLITLNVKLPDSGEGMGAQARIEHHLMSPRHVWIPHVAPEPGFVVGDHSFRSPALLFADERIALAVLPNLDDVEAARKAGMRLWLDYDHPTRTITVGAGNYAVDGFHVGYRARPARYTGQALQVRLHVVNSTRPEDRENPYGLAARWHWEQKGHTRHTAGGSQLAPLSKYAEYITKWAFGPGGWSETVWQSFTLNGEPVGGPAFIVDVAQHPSIPVDKRRWREQRSIWNQAWFSTQRCANGLLRHARQIGSKELEDRARQMTRIALLAPQKDGLFPSVYTTGGGGYSLYKDSPDWSQAHWTNSDRRPPTASAEACHILDAAFTARLLLEWHDIVGPSETAAIPYVRRFADRLCELQMPSGAFPGWVEPDGQVPYPLAEGPETAMGAALQLELAERFPTETRYRESAVRALRYLENGPVAQGRWEDFETYFSCSRWGGSDRMGAPIERNGVYKSNTLSHFWCAEAFLLAHRALKEKRYLAVGRRCLDELSLFQQVWDPSWIPAPCHGGWGVMNADGEWNDARQSLFAPLYLDYYRATGESEYFERGVAGLRASFAMLYCPENAEVRRAYEKQHPMFGPESYGFMMENIAHGGPGTDVIGPFTIFTWGNGAALAAAATVRDRYGDVFIDTVRKAAFGIDGCTAAVTKTGSVEIQDRYNRPELTVVYASGARRPVRLTSGKGEVPLSD